MVIKQHFKWNREFNEHEALRHDIDTNGCHRNRDGEVLQNSIIYRG